MSLLCWLVKPTSTSGGQLHSHVSTDEPQTESQNASSASLTGVNTMQPVSSTEFFPVKALEIEGLILVTRQPNTATGPLEDPKPSYDPRKNSPSQAFISIVRGW